jgi:hypothetical protein
MAQADFFGNLDGALSKLDAAKKANIITAQQEEEHINKMLSMYDAINAKKAAGREWDLKTQSVYQNLKRFGKEMAEDAENLKKAKKGLKKTEVEISNMAEVAKKLEEKGNKAAADLVKKKKAQLEVEKEIQEVNYETAKSSVSKLGQALNMFGKVGGFLSSSFGGLFSMFGNILGAAFDIGKAIFKIIFPIEKAWKLFLEMQKVVGALSADIGMTNKEYYRLLDAMPTIYNEILEYGGKIEDVGKIIKGFSEDTGKNRIFSTKEITDIVNLGNSTGLAVEGVTKMVAEFDNLGYSLGTTLKVAQKGRNEAARFNINQTKLLQTTTEVVKALTGSGFGRSVEGLTKLAAKAESLRFNLAESIKSFKDAFFSPEKAVEAAAKIQVLGGEFAQMFGDPFQLMYDSMNNADGMAEKLINAAKGLAIKNKNGDFIIPPAQRQILKEVAESLGQNYDSIVNAAIEQAKTSDKMNALSKRAGSLVGFSDDDKQSLANLMTINKSGQYEIKMPNGISKLVSSITSKDQLQTILNQRKANDEAAKQRLTLQDRFNNILERFAIGLTPLFTELNKLLADSGLLNEIEKLGKDIASTLIPLIKDVFSPGGKFRTGVDMFLSGFKEFIGGIRKIMNGDGTFFGKMKEIFSDIIKFVFENVMPYVKIIFGEILKSMKDIPLVGESLWKAGIAMETKDKNTRDKASAMGIDNKGNLTEIVKNLRKDDESSTFAGDFFGGLGNGLMGVLDGAGGLAASLVGWESAAQEMYTSSGARFRRSGADFADAFTGGNEYKQALTTNALKGGGYSDQKYLELSDLDAVPVEMRAEIAEASKVNDYLALSNGQAMSGAPGSAMALISELNANKYANSNTNSSQQTITVVVSGELEAKTKNGTQKINAKEFYDSDPVMMGEWIKRTMSQNSNGSANYIVDFGVAPI